MTAGNVVIRRRRFLVGKTTWLIVAFGVIILIGMVIQFRMTWSREHVRGITSDAVDAIDAAKTGAAAAVPSSNPLQPLFDLFQE
jgi:hypothetical protein